MDPALALRARMDTPSQTCRVRCADQLVNAEAGPWHPVPCLYAVLRWNASTGSGVSVDLFSMCAVAAGEFPAAFRASSGDVAGEVLAAFRAFVVGAFEFPFPQESLAALAASAVEGQAFDFEHSQEVKSDEHEAQIADKAKPVADVPGNHPMLG